MVAAACQSSWTRSRPCRSDHRSYVLLSNPRVGASCRRCDGSSVFHACKGGLAMIGNAEIHAAMKAAAKAAWHAGHGRLDHDDCVSEANEAVALAMRTFDPSKGC